MTKLRNVCSEIYVSAIVVTVQESSVSGYRKRYKYGVFVHRYMKKKHILNIRFNYYHFYYSM